MKPKEPAQADVDELVEALYQYGTWAKAEKKLSDFGDERKLRQMASASGGRIGSGQKGYIHVKRMTPEEFGHYTAWMTSQAQKMLERVREARAARNEV